MCIRSFYCTVFSLWIIGSSTLVWAQEPDTSLSQDADNLDDENIIEKVLSATVLPDTSEFDRKPIVAIQIQADAKFWKQRLPTPALKIGQPFKAHEVRAELQRLLSIGFFTTGTIKAEKSSNGVKLTFELTPARWIRRILFKGNILNEESLKRSIQLDELRYVTDLKLEKITADIRAYYQKHGFPNAYVFARTIETDQLHEVIVEFSLEPGRERTIAQRIFLGVPRFNDAALQAAQKYMAHVGQRVDEEMLNTADRAFEGTLRSLGFHDATVSHAITLNEARNGEQVTLKIQVLAGSQISIQFNGNQKLDSSALFEILNLKSEIDRSPARLVSTLETAYHKRGYWDARVRFELLGRSKDTQRILRFQIYEGDLVTLQKRVFPCLRGALDEHRINEEIDSYFQEELESGNGGELDHEVIDQVTVRGEIARGARIQPPFVRASEIYAPEIYERAVEHVRDLFRSEGYIFAEVSDPTLLRAACDKRSQPGPTGCRALTLPSLPNLCRTDLEGLPKESLPIPKSFTCTPNDTHGVACSPIASLAIPINPGPRSIVWDIAFDGVRAFSHAELGKANAMGRDLRTGEPLSLKEVEDARKRLVDFYRDAGYAFASVRPSIEYSLNKTRARVRFLVSEGERVEIDAITIRGAQLTSEWIIRERLGFKVGELYQAKRVRTAQEKLAQLGVFSSVSIGLVNPTIPTKRKTVLISVVERKPQYFEARPGFSTGEGFRVALEYSYNNLNIGDYVASLLLRARLAYQPFIPRNLYDPSLVQRWTQLDTVDRLTRRASLLLALPHSVILGSDVRTALEFIYHQTLLSDFRFGRISPVLSFTYQPVRWFSAVFATDYERNDFSFLVKQSVDAYLANPNNQRFASILRVPDGVTGVGAARVNLLFDFRDNRLAATKNGYFSLTTEYVRTLLRATDRSFGDTSSPTILPAARQDFLHLVFNGGVYTKLRFLPKHPVLAFELNIGANLNIFSCAGNPQTVYQYTLKDNPTPQTSIADDCDTYPDRLFYLGGPSSVRGIYIGQMFPQDSIDRILRLSGANSSTGNPAELIPLTPRGGNFFINPRLELRVPMFRWGGFVLFVEAANTWRDKSQIRPWQLRYSAGPGLSLDTPVGPIALDLGINLSRYEAFGESLLVFHFSVGRF